MMILWFIFSLIIIDLALRARRTTKAKLRTFETLSFILVLILAMMTSSNIGLLSIIGATMLSTAMILKEFYANAFASIYMYLLPQYESDDLILIQDKNYPSTPMIFKELGWLRTPLFSTTGDVVNIPNRILLNEGVQTT